MKNQYFGDVNDFRKYGLLRAFSKTPNLTLSVVWMLTRRDRLNDGHFIDYLSKPEQYRHFDQILFDWLQHIVLNEGDRRVARFEASKLLNDATFYSSLVPHDAEERSTWFQTLLADVADRDLIFLDPDNGIEVKSVPYGRKHSEKYIYWQEIRSLVEHEHSLLIYQHFPRVKRSLYIDRIKDTIKVETGYSDVFAFRTSRVVFFLAIHSNHSRQLGEAIERVKQTWWPEIQLE